jgi:hypothetical protein
MLMHQLPMDPLAKLSHRNLHLRNANRPHADGLFRLETAEGSHRQVLIPIFPTNTLNMCLARGAR